MTKVEVSEIEEHLNRGKDITVVDSRSAAAWGDSDVKAAGAVRIPPDEAEKHIADVSRDGYIVTYCTPDRAKLPAPVWHKFSKNMDSQMCIRWSSDSMNGWKKVCQSNRSEK